MPAERVDVAIATRWYVYALCEPATGEIRYIGKSRNPWTRLDSHRSHNAAQRIRKWVSSLTSSPKLRILSEFDTDREARHEEERLISEARASGVVLLNRKFRDRSPGSHPRRNRFSGLGPRVTQRREALGLTQTEIMLACGISQGTLSRIENGQKRSPSAETAVVIARALRVSVEWLVTGEELVLKASAA